MYFWEVINMLSESRGWQAVLLHCNANNLVLKFLKHYKILGKFALAYSNFKFWGTCPDLRQ